MRRYAGCLGMIMFLAVNAHAWPNYDKPGHDDNAKPNKMPDRTITRTYNPGDPSPENPPPTSNDYYLRVRECDKEFPFNYQIQERVKSCESCDMTAISDRAWNTYHDIGGSPVCYNEKCKHRLFTLKGWEKSCQLNRMTVDMTWAVECKSAGPDTDGVVDIATTTFITKGPGKSGQGISLKPTDRSTIVTDESITSSTTTLQAQACGTTTYSEFVYKEKVPTCESVESYRGYVERAKRQVQQAQYFRKCESPCLLAYYKPPLRYEWDCKSERNGDVTEYWVIVKTWIDYICREKP